MGGRGAGAVASRVEDEESRVSRSRHGCRCAPCPLAGTRRGGASARVRVLPVGWMWRAPACARVAWGGGACG
eukprot:71709-Chlamydomonas_euryale.AAC.1